MRLYRAPGIYDGTDRSPLEGGAIRVDEAGRIVEIGPASDLRPDGAAVVELEGTLVPGLIDAHVHLCLSGGADPVAELRGASTARVLVQIQGALRRHLAAGVTTVRDLGAPGGLVVELARLVEEGRIPGPRVIAAGHALCVTGGHGAFIGREVDGADGFTRAVREELRAGATAIKLVATGGVMTEGTDPGALQMAPEELRAAVVTAARAGARVAAHAQGAEGVREALRAGVATIEHGIWLDDEALALFRAKGAYLVPTFNAVRGICSGRGRGVPDFQVDKMDAVAAIHAASFRRAVAAGVLIAAGTDAGTPLNAHGGLVEELVSLVEHGLTAHEALQAATGGAAAALGLPDVGILEAGRWADLVEIDGDPLQDLRALGRVRTVIRGGVALDPVALATWPG